MKLAVDYWQRELQLGGRLHDQCFEYNLTRQEANEFAKCLSIVYATEKQWIEDKRKRDEARAESKRRLMRRKR